MKVYELGVAEDIELVVPVPMSGTALKSVAGVRQGDTWRPVEVELITSQDGRRLQPVDCPFLNSALLVIKDYALDQVREAIAPYAEILPLACASAALSAVNVLNIVDALDEDASEYSRLPDGRYILIDRHVFNPGRVPKEGLFKIPQYRKSSTYCTEPTAQVLLDNLSGLNLREVWQG